MKAQEVRNLIAMENYKAALCGAKDFRIGVSDEQRSVMRRGYECMVHAEFYLQIGIDPEKAIEAGINTLQEVL
jgi:hypothetical protein